MRACRSIFEGEDVLVLLVFGDGEVFFTQAFDGVALLVGDDNVDGDAADLQVEDHAIGCEEDLLGEWGNCWQARRSDGGCGDGERQSQEQRCNSEAGEAGVHDSVLFVGCCGCSARWFRVGEWG